MRTAIVESSKLGTDWTSRALCGVTDCHCGGVYRDPEWVSTDSIDRWGEDTLLLERRGERGNLYW